MCGIMFDKALASEYLERMPIIRAHQQRRHIIKTTRTKRHIAMQAIRSFERPCGLTSLNLSQEEKAAVQALFGTRGSLE